MAKQTWLEHLREVYDECEFVDVETFEEFVAMFDAEMNKVKSVGEMIEERQLGRCGFDVKKVREIEKQNAKDGIHYETVRQEDKQKSKDLRGEDHD
jgi:hypothetical protein